MTFVLNVPPSQVSKLAREAGDDDEDAPDRKKSREEYRQLKELEEARKAGTVPAMKDEEGKDINPHIPQYVMQVPWYYGSFKPTLMHQRTQDTAPVASVNDNIRRGLKDGPVATRFRKGACQNCGAMTHQKKDCLERPRKVGARFTGEAIAPDEHLPDTLQHNYEGKRDRWNNFDASDFNAKLQERYDKLDSVKQKLREKRRADEQKAGADEDHELDPNEDDAKGVDDMDMPGTKMDSSERMTVRNLRIREDTAKYLYNLDPNSAYYDPKTHAMRGNPFEGTGKDPSDVPFAGDNFVRHSADAQAMAQQQLFSWEIHQKGLDVHLQADPTKLELLTKDYQEKKKQLKANVSKAILNKYGGEEHLKAPPKELLFDND